MRLGRKAVKQDSRTLRLADYLCRELPAAPVSVDWTKGLTNWGMLLNNQLGDCTIAGAMHATMVWCAAQGLPETLTDALALSYYGKWCGYNPANPASDQGGILLDICKDWKAQGLDNFTLSAFASVDPKNIEHVKQAINLFGGAYIGVALPLSAQDQAEWDVKPRSWICRWLGVPAESPDPTPGSWGGHCVYAVGYDETTVTVITWGGLLKMTWAFWTTYVDECYALLAPIWIGTKGSPQGFNLDQLTVDLGAIA